MFRPRFLGRAFTPPGEGGKEPHALSAYQPAVLFPPLRLCGWPVVTKAAALEYPDGSINGESTRVPGRVALDHTLPVSAVVTLLVATLAVLGCGHGPLLSRVQKILVFSRAVRRPDAAGIQGGSMADWWAGHGRDVGSLWPSRSRVGITER